MGIAVAIPHLGGAEKVIVSVTELMVVALLAPTLWGLFSRCLPSYAIWITAAISFIAGILVRFVYQADSTLMKTFTGVILPVLVLVVLQKLSRNIAPGYQRLQNFCSQVQPNAHTAAIGKLPALIVAWSIAACGLLLLLPLLWDRQSSRILLGFSATLFIGAACIGWFIRGRSDEDPSA